MLVKYKSKKSLLIFIHFSVEQPRRRKLKIFQSNTFSHQFCNKFKRSKLSPTRLWVHFVRLVTFHFRMMLAIAAAVIVLVNFSQGAPGSTLGESDNWNISAIECIITLGQILCALFSRSQWACGDRSYSATSTVQRWVYLYGKNLQYLRPWSP